MVLSDPASCANHDQVQLEKLEIEWLIDFDNKVLEGETTQTFRVTKNNLTSINLDCRDITIESIDVNETPADYTRTPQYEGKNVFGDKLSISTAEHAPGSVIKVHIRFKTSSKAGAVQWISTEQTTDHIQPSAFTFCQPIGARSILPCMDTPIVKCPVYSKLSVPSTTIGLMAAIRVGEVEKDKPRNGYDTYSYEQTIPIPSYLISFIVGVFESQDISDRIRVWAEPSMLAKAAYEFANSEESLKLAENLFGDFVWKRSDMIVLPKSFPLGGMENPCLIFVNPTIITGDRSETMLLIHEQIHAWWGNLVTNASWGDMWLNEGFTTYFERRIGALLYGEQYRQFSNLKAWSSILEPLVFERFSPSHPYTRLIIDQSGGIDPNEAFSLNYYEKGQVFLYFLETKIGREDFDTYCRNYLETFARKTVDSITWKQHFIGFFRKKTHLLEDIDFDAWMYGPGLPPIKPNYDDRMLRECMEYAEIWKTESENQLRKNSNNLIKRFNNFIPIQRVEFLSLLRISERTLPASKLELLEEFFHFNTSTYCEIMHYWIRVAIRSRWKPIIPVAYKYVTEFGRLKIIQPIFRDLRAWPETSDGIVEVFRKNIPAMHPFAVEQIERDLNI